MRIIAKKNVNAENRYQLTLGKNSKYILVLLTRAVETVDGYQLNSNTVVSTDDLFIR